jgi:hypothetical protein
MTPATGKALDSEDSGLPTIPEANTAFVAAAKSPTLLEPGEDPFPITRDNFVLSGSGTRPTLECWTTSNYAPARNLVRRIVGIRAVSRAKLQLETERFGGQKGSLSLIDAASPHNATASRQGSRLKYREVFRLSLKRQFPDWRIVELSTEQDLEHSLSPVYPRAFLRKGNAGLAAIGAAEDCFDPDGVLSFGLIWLDYLRKREAKVTVGGLALFLPIGRESNTCHRVRYLNPQLAKYTVFAYGSGITEELVDPAAYTNFETRLHPFQAASFRARQLDLDDAADCISLPDGSTSLRVHGVEFARHIVGSHDSTSSPNEGKLLYGLERKRAAGSANFPEIEALSRGLARLRNFDSTDRSNRLYLRQPEAWLESQVRTHLDRVDATLRTTSIYEQAPQYAAGDRSILDLLAVDYDGRLCVVEIKASQDIHLPLQALDYWMRVKWHLERGEFSRNGYFPGITLRNNDAPRLLLVAPAIEFHPSNETILRFFSSQVTVQRIGIGLEWRRDLRVMFRM